jgi:hypothetical protein
MIFSLIKTSSSWTNADSSMNLTMKIGRREEMPKLRPEIIVWQKLWFFVCYLFHHFLIYHFHPFIIHSNQLAQTL